MKNKLTWLEGALVLAPFVLLLIFWHDIPPRVPIHWNLSSEIDGWGGKEFYLPLLPLISFGLIMLLRLLPQFDPKLQTKLALNERMLDVLQILRLAFAAFCFAIFLALLTAALGYSISSRIISSAVLILFAVLGNYLGVLRPNYFIGLRTPWTLESPATWRATHRLGGRLMFFGSLALLLLQFVLSDQLTFLLIITATLSFAAWTL
ncbi:MAG: SdpI family protein, partial [Chthoniobacterales bacterium]